MREYVTDQNMVLGGQSCTVCPLECGCDRAINAGACGVGGLGKEMLGGRDPYSTALVARAARHYFEEPPISGTNGSGAIFFSGCNMRCIFCQNIGISSKPSGKPVCAEELAQIMLRLEEIGSHNINFVTPTPHAKLISEAIVIARNNGLKIPTVYNTNGYDKVDTLKSLEGLIDIYLPDLKYRSAAAARKYSGREDYFSVASRAVLEMQRQCGVLELDPNGIAKRGLIIRHLVLPGSVDETRGVLNFIYENMPVETHISLMSQYTPMVPDLPTPLDRRLKKREYNRAVDYALSLGFNNLFIQELDSASSVYTPEFNDFFE